MTVIYKKYLREATLKKIGLVQLTVLATVWVEHWSCLVKAVDDGIRVEGSCSKAQQQRDRQQARPPCPRFYEATMT